MTALLILLVLVAGFLHCHIHPVQKIRLHRYTGQYLYLRAAGYGLRALAASAALALIGRSLLPNALTMPLLGMMPTTPILWLSSFLKNTGAAGDSLLQNAWLLALALGMFTIVFLHAIVSFGLACLRHRTLNPSPHITGKLLMDSPLDALLFRLSLERKMVMLSMADRKVYVGMIADMGEPTETQGPDNEIAIIPMLSGYRDKDSLKAAFTTFYKEFYDRNSKGGQKADGYASAHAALTIVLRQSDIVSATEFSDTAYAHWNTAAGPERGLARPRPGYTRNGLRVPPCLYRV